MSRVAYKNAVKHIRLEILSSHPLAPMSKISRCIYPAGLACNWHASREKHHMTTVLSGRMVFQARGGAPLICKAGTVISIPPNTELNWQVERSSTLIHCHHNGFEFEVHGALAFFFGSMLKRLAKAEIEGKSLEAFKHALAMASISAAQDLAFSLANLQVMLAAIESVQKPQIRNGNPMQSPLARCLNHIEANLNRQLSLAELAKHSYVCSSRLMQLFKAKLGETPIQYISRRRAALAEQMIQEENRTVSEVASLLDFHSLSYFTRFFKKQTGRNPSKLRHESRNTI